MPENIATQQICVIIGASQAGVSCAFTLREEGWKGSILLFDADPKIPYAKPPLSKTALTGEEELEEHILKPLQLYENERITLNLGIQVLAIDRIKKFISLSDGNIQQYHKLIIATGARPLIPKIAGIYKAKNIFSLRTAQDVLNIRAALSSSLAKRVVIIGGGYVGLETAASLNKLGAQVTILEREERVLARVTAPEISEFFTKLHRQKGVEVLTSKNVVSLETDTDLTIVKCSDRDCYKADLIIVGVGISINMELAENAGLDIENGILVDAAARTSDEHIYAIGDCTFHHNPYYDRYVRLESVQNANDQAKIAAEAICGKSPRYHSLPWFWSDQYEVKLQMVGLSEGYNETIIRREEKGDSCFSVWYFKNDRLLAVDAVNATKAYVIGTKFIKAGIKVNKMKLSDNRIELKPANLILR